MRLSSFGLVGLLLLGATSLRAINNPPSAKFSVHELAQGYRDEVILAKPRAEYRATVAAAEIAEGVQVRETFSRLGDVRVVQVPTGENPKATIARLQATGRYEYVERDYLMKTEVAPNDTYYTSQWGLNNFNQFGGGQGFDIKANRSWDIIHDAPNVVVAVIDSGARITHEDLAGNLWINPSPTFGDVNGARILKGVRSGNVADDNGHGTHVAGIIGAVGNNRLGIAGVAWRVQLMILKNAGADGFSANSDSAACIDYAVAHGAHIINCSFGGTSFSQTMLDAIKAARTAGVIVVASAGNDGLSNDVSPRYPANYQTDNLVTVGNSGFGDVPSSSSDYGASVDLYAPGTQIASLDYSSDTDYVYMSGTSMAAPHVTGALALLKAKFPTDTFRQLINRMLNSTDFRNSMVGKSQTGGRLNLFNALSTAPNLPFNDNFVARPQFTSSIAQLRSNNVGATIETGEPQPAGLNMTNTLWWQWTAPYSGSVVVDSAGSDFDTVLAVYEGPSLSTLTLIGTNDNDGAAQTSKITFNAVSGHIYQLCLGGKFGSAGPIVLTLAMPPANDQFANATTLTGESARAAGVLKQASLETGEPKILDADGGVSVWFKWTAPRAGRFQISAFSYSCNMLLGVYTGSAVNNLALVTASNDTPVAAGLDDNTDSRCTLNAVAGTTYYLKLDAKDPERAADFVLSITDSLWQASTQEEVNGSPAIAPDGTIYFGSGPRLFALNPDGSVKWTYATTGDIEYAAPAIGDDGTIFFGTTDGTVLALKPDGTKKWQQSLGANNDASVTPAIAADGTIYIHAADGQLYALNPANGTTKWSYNTHSVITIGSAVIAPDGTIYQMSDDTYLYALNPDGTLKWKFSHGSTAYATPALDAAGNIYIATYSSSRVFSVSPTGAVRWTSTGIAGGVLSSPALNADASTVYIVGGDHRLYALNNSNGQSRWSYLMDDRPIFGSPAIDSNGVVYIGTEDSKLYAINSTGTLKRTWQAGLAIRTNPVIFGTTLYVGSIDAKLYAFDIGAFPLDGPWSQYGQNARRLGRAVVDPLAITVAPQSRVVAAGQELNLSMVTTGRGALVYQWNRNGAPVASATSATFTLAATSSANTGIYNATATGSQGTVTSGLAIVGVSTTNKVIGTGSEIAANIVHPITGFTYDQILLDGAAATFTADSAENQITRLSYIDLTNDIIQVEFSGHGSVSIVLDNPTGPATPINYNQSVSYMKGHAGIVVTGADETTNLSVFSVGRGTASNSALFKSDVTYDGLADIAFIAITSTNGKFGGLRTANANYFATRGITGVYAPGVQFTGPVFVGDIGAQDNATPYLVIGSGSDVRVTGGDMLQANNRAVVVSGITQLKFTAGSTSHFVDLATTPTQLLAAKTNKGRFEQNGVDVTSQIVVNPTP